MSVSCPLVRPLALALFVAACLASVPHRADAVGARDIAAFACPAATAARQNVTFDCAGDALTLYVTFEMPESVPDVTAIDATLTLDFGNDPVPDFWDFETNDANMYGSQVRPSTICSAYTNTWSGLGGFIALASKGTTTETVAVTVYKTAPIAAIAGQKMYGFQLTFDPATAIESGGTQAGCTHPVSITLNSLTIDGAAGAQVQCPPGSFGTSVYVNVVKHLTPSVTGNGSISPSSMVTVPRGGSQTFTMAAAPCNHIADVLVDGVSVGAVSSYAFTNVTDDHTIQAVMAPDPFPITASAGAGGSISPVGVVVVGCGSSQTFSVTPDPCYHIADVLVDGASIGAATSYTFTNVHAAHAIAAAFALNTYTISAGAGAGGSITPNGVTPVGCGGSQAYTIVASPCASIADVLVDGVSVGAVSSYTFTNVQANHTIAAAFSGQTFTLTASAGANGSISPSGAVGVGCGAAQAFTIAPAPCYDVADVLVDGVSVGAVTSYTFANVQAAHTIAASFALRSYAITASAGANGAISPAGATSVNCGSSQAYTITPNACYAVAGVLVDGVPLGALTSYTFTNVQAPHTIAATFTLLSYTITASANAGGTISPSGATAVSCGGSQAYTITPGACVHVLDVLVDGGSVGAVTSYTFANVQANHTISAAFAQNGPYTITAGAGTGGSISPSGALSVACGGSQAYTIAPNSCFVIADVTVDGVSIGAVSSYAFANVQANHAIAATFSAQGAYAITAVAGANGAIAPAGVTMVNCGGSQAYTIVANACYAIADVLVDGVSVGAVASYTFASVHASHAIAASFAFAVMPVAPVTGLTATQLRSGNDGDGTTKIALAFTAPGGTTVEVWRRGFGGYPRYDDAGGAAPAAPASYPPAGWTPTAITATGQTDEPATRDFWYYVAYAKDACGNASPASVIAGGALNYYLGDVTDGVTAGLGDNGVAAPDLLLLAARYGASGAALTGSEYLDVGPTTDRSPVARPATDGVVDFEDLMMFALDYAPRVSLLAGSPQAAPLATRATATADQISANAPASVTANQDFDVDIVVSGAGDLLGLSTTLAWNPSIAAPTGLVTAGAFFASQGGTVLSPGPGRADGALLGPPAGITGLGTVAKVRFHALATGDPQVTLQPVTGRDNANQDVPVQVMSQPLAAGGPASATEFRAVVPNPAPGHASLAYSLAADGPVDLSIYSVDGRRVRTLVHAVRAAGRHEVTWDGTDEAGTVMRSGVYFARFESPGVRSMRRFTVVR